MIAAIICPLPAHCCGEKPVCARALARSCVNGQSEKGRCEMKLLWVSGWELPIECKRNNTCWLIDGVN